MLQANIHQSTGKLELALDVLKQVLNREPDSVSVMVETARVYEKLGDYDNALALSERIIRQAPRDSRGHSLKSEILEASKKK